MSDALKFAVLHSRFLYPFRIGPGPKIVLIQESGSPERASPFAASSRSRAVSLRPREKTLQLELDHEIVKKGVSPH